LWSPQVRFLNLGLAAGGRDTVSEGGTGRPFGDLRTGLGYYYAEIFFNPGFFPSGIGYSTEKPGWQGHGRGANLAGAYTQPSEAKAVSDAQPRATPSTAPASTSLRKCIPSTMRDTAMLTARKNSIPSSPG
jgi:hypothetical protein